MLIDYYTIDGTQTVKDGTGTATYYYEDTSLVSSQGNYLNGYKFGLWKGYYENGDLHYEENYDEYTGVKGTSWDEDGKTHKYNELEVSSEPKLGYSHFYQFVARKMVYPKSARRQGIEGKVFVEFIVDRSGAITNVKTIRGISPECDAEAVRAIKSYPNWNPPLQRGLPVRQKIVLPITFKLT